jgi:hypothetical protein
MEKTGDGCQEAKMRAGDKDNGGYDLKRISWSHISLRPHLRLQPSNTRFLTNVSLPVRFCVVLQMRHIQCIDCHIGDV